MRVLIIEDERRLSNIIKKGLIEDGFAVDQAFDAEEGQYLAESEKYDAIILDIMLGSASGLSICRTLRQQHIKTPILILTAKSHVEDTVKGLYAGADDIMTKPFSFLELRSRIHALIRRSHQEVSPVLKIEDLEIDPLKHTVRKGGEIVLLTPKEFSILEFLMRHRDEVVTRTSIIEHVWDYSFEGMSNVIDVFVGSIRKKIDKKGKKLIRTVHGIGYTIS